MQRLWDPIQISPLLHSQCSTCFVFWKGRPICLIFSDVAKAILQLCLNRNNIYDLPLAPDPLLVSLLPAEFKGVRLRRLLLTGLSRGLSRGLARGLVRGLPWELPREAAAPAISAPAASPPAAAPIGISEPEFWFDSAKPPWAEGLLVSA